MLKLILIFSLAKCAISANILVLSPLPSPSHHFFNRALVVALTEKGHNVTMLGCHEEKKTQGFHYIQMEGLYEAIHELFDISTMSDQSAMRVTLDLYDMGEVLCKLIFETKGIQKLMDYPKDFKFDLIVNDITFPQCTYGFIDRFNTPPVVGITAFLLPLHLANAMGGHVHPSYYPHYGLQVTNKMSFFERMHSFLLAFAEIWYRNNIYAQGQNNLLKEYFGASSRTMEEYERDIAMLLSNTDPILDYPVSLPPNIIAVGGMHLETPKKLPGDLQKVMNESKHGVILFSLGSNIQSSLLGPGVRDELLAAFSKLKETVIWKYEEKIEGLPKNVVIRKWLPQNDILGDPKCKLFISHGGGLSTQEALYNAVPIVGIPFFGDQHKNVHKFVSANIGVKLGFNQIQRDNIYKSIQEVLRNPHYQNNIEALSKKYHDQPQTPLERAVFWVEYVLRHGGAKDLELPARDMHFLQTTNLDVVAFLIGAPLLAVLIIYKSLRSLWCSQKKQEKLKKK